MRKNLLLAVDLQCFLMDVRAPYFGSCLATGRLVRRPGGVIRIEWSMTELQAFTS